MGGGEVSTELNRRFNDSEVKHYLITINTGYHTFHVEILQKKWRILSHWPQGEPPHDLKTFPQRSEYGNFKSSDEWNDFRKKLTTMTQNFTRKKHMNDSKMTYDEIFKCHPSKFDYEWEDWEFYESEGQWAKDRNNYVVYVINDTVE